MHSNLLIFFSATAGTNVRRMSFSCNKLIKYVVFFPQYSVGVLSKQTGYIAFAANQLQYQNTDIELAQ